MPDAKGMSDPMRVPLSKPVYPLAGGKEARLDDLFPLMASTFGSRHEPQQHGIAANAVSLGLLLLDSFVCQLAYEVQLMVRSHGADRDSPTRRLCTRACGLPYDWSMTAIFSEADSHRQTSVCPAPTTRMLAPVTKAVGFVLHSA